MWIAGLAGLLIVKGTPGLQFLELIEQCQRFARGQAVRVGCLDPGPQRILAFVRERDEQWYFTALGQSVWHVEGRDERLHRDLLEGHLMERDYEGRVVPATQSPLAYDTVDQLAEALLELPFGGAL